jgi:hypothetical protein
MKSKLVIKSRKIAKKLSSRQGQLDEIPGKAFTFFKKTTPIRSGNARRRTRLQGGKIQADYPYAQRLDKGYSRQAPQGMSGPTIKYIQDLLARIGRK